MNVSYKIKDAMTFIGYLTEIRPEQGYSAREAQPSDHACGVRAPVTAK